VCRVLGKAIISEGGRYSPEYKLSMQCVAPKTSHVGTVCGDLADLDEMRRGDCQGREDVGWLR